MQVNQNLAALSKENLEIIYTEYFRSYGVSQDITENLVRESLAEVYNAVGYATILETGHVEITVEKKGRYEVSRVILSSKKKALFRKILSLKIEKEQNKIFESLLKSKLQVSNFILYAKPLYHEKNRITFQMYDIRKERIDNLFGNLEISESLKIDYSIDGVFFLVRVSDNMNLIKNTGRYYIRIRNTDNRVLTIYINSVFKKLNASVQNIYGYKNFSYTKENDNLVIFLKGKTISKTASKYISDKLKEYCGVNATVLTRQK